VLLFATSGFEGILIHTRGGWSEWSKPLDTTYFSAILERMGVTEIGTMPE